MPLSDAVFNQRAERAVSDYIKHHRDDAARELCFYRSMPTLARAIRRAALARTADGGKHPHQWRIPPCVLREFGAQLARRERGLSEAGSFDELHEAVRGVGVPIRGIGELVVYDTALRIGAWLDIRPARVYLHRGTREGAEAVRIDHRRSTVAVSDLPSSFARLAPHEIEDCLCIFKGLLSGKPSPQPTGCRCNGGGCARRLAGTARVRC